MGSSLWVQKSWGGKRRVTAKCLLKKCLSSQGEKSRLGSGSGRGRLHGAHGHILSLSSTVLQVGLWTFALFDNLSRGVGRAVSARRRGPWGGTLTGDLLRTRRARVPPSDSTRPLCPIPSPAASFWAEVSRASPSSPSPTRPGGPSLSGSPACLRAA